MTTFNFIYEADFPRLIPAIEIDARASNPAIANQIGSVIQAYCNAQVALVTANVLVYKIESNTGNLAGYFTVQVNGVGGTLYFSTFRPAFAQFSAQLYQQISSFISNGGWKPDFLFP